MPRNKVQFQKGMSLAEFPARYGSEAQYAQALHAWRWPQGFVCSGCGCAGHCRLGWGLLQCHRCPRQTSLTSGTLLPQSKDGISALNLSRQLGISYNSAWVLKHKRMQTMLGRERGRPLRGVTYLDDAYWGGRRRGYKRGLGSRNKTPSVAAVATHPDSGKPLFMRMSRVRVFRSRELGCWSCRHLTAGAQVCSDGLRLRPKAGLHVTRALPIGRLRIGQALKLLQTTEAATVEVAAVPIH